MEKEKIQSEENILHEQLVRLDEAAKKTTDAHELVEISNAMVALFKATKFSIYG